MESVWISKKISMSIFIIPSLTQKNLCFWLQVYAHISNLVQPKFNQDKMEVLIIWVSNLLSTMGSKWKKSVIIFEKVTVLQIVIVSGNELLIFMLKG